jgi:beta-1,4-mannooligosaccharide/beta-1,4-mannosyl-N-acetylglucosamine phosphorylase
MLEFFKRYKNNPILTAENWPYPVNSVFNAGVTKIGNETLLLVRCEDFRGHSHLTVARSKNGFDDWEIDKTPTFDKDLAHRETWGVEDPRVTWLEEMGLWAITYTAYSNDGPMISIMTTTDFKKFNRLGIALPSENKDAAIFPRKINGRWVMLHRPVNGWGANIWLSYSPDLIHWGGHHVVLRGRGGGWWDGGKVGGNCPPIETDYGWLMNYHAVRHTASSALYRMGIALLDKDKPEIVVKRGDEWIFGPKEKYELFGDVKDVVFPCGWTLDNDGDTINMYYGAADTGIALATASLKGLLSFLGVTE